MKLNSICLAAAACLLSVAAQAQQAAAPSPLYGEIGYSVVQVHVPTALGNLDVKPKALRAVVGYNFNPNFAAETMLAVGTQGDSQGAVNVRIRTASGIFLKPKVAFGDFELFARAGWATTRGRMSAGSFTGNSSDNDFAWGAGVNYSFNPRTYVSVDYLRLLDKDGVKIDGATLGVGYRF